MKEKTSLELLLEQYDTNNKSSYEKKTEKSYDLKNYFNTILKDHETNDIKEIRILPGKNGKSPFDEFYGHKIQVDGQTRTFACLKHESGEPCPFCEVREGLLATGKETDKELAKKYSARLFYVTKVIDRENPKDGVKFWRFSHDYRKEGVFDKIHGVLKSLKTNKDITDPQNGRDLAITINRNQNKVPIVSAIVALDSTPISESNKEINDWLSDERTWKDVYAIKPYDYLQIIVSGGTPYWDNDKKCFVDKKVIKETIEETNKLDEELTMGIENVKNSIKEAKNVPVTNVKSEDKVDDMPF